MKRSTIIAIAFITYIIAMIAMFVTIDQYIHAKDCRLRSELYQKLSEIFNGRDKIVDIVTSGNTVKYSPMPIPQSPFKNYKQSKEEGKVETRIDEDIIKKINDERQNDYGDLYKMYHIHWKSSEKTLGNPNPEGWKLCIFQNDAEGIYLTNVFPYAIGYKKQQRSGFYSYVPNVQTAVNEAFDFYTNNNKSTYYQYFQKGSANAMWSEIYNAENEYYYLRQDKTPRFWRGMGNYFIDDTIKQQNGRDICPIKNGDMHNGYYRVFIAESQPQTYTIQKRPWKPDESDKKNLSRNWAIGLTILHLLIVIPLWIIDRMHQKIKDESLYDKLKRLCNPSNFIKDYNKEKVDAANTIYQRLMETASDDADALNEIQAQAVSMLGITLIDQEKLNNLKEKVNPKNFMNPYNAEKVALANELYSRLAKEDLIYSEFSEIEEQSKKL